MNEQLMTVRITDDHLRAIGRVIVQFSVLEMRIRYLIWRLMNCRPESVARLVTAELGFRQLVRLLLRIPLWKYFDVRHGTDTLISHRQEIYGHY